MVSICLWCDVMAGKPLAADAWVAKLKVPTDELLAKEKQEYEAAIKAGPK